MLNLLDILFLPSDHGFLSASQVLEEMHCSTRHLEKIHSCIHDFMADRSSSLQHLPLKQPVKQPISTWLGGTWSWPSSLPMLLLFIFNLPRARLFLSWRPHTLTLPIALGTAALQVFVYHHVQVEGHQPPREMLALNRPQIKGSGSVMSPTAAPKTTYCTKWEPLAIQTKT